MPSITLTETQSAPFADGPRSIELRDPAGQVLAVALSADEYRRYLYATMREATPDAEIDRAREEFRARGGVTTDELHRRIERLGIPGAGQP